MMNAVLKCKGAPGHMKFASVPIPSISPDQVLIEVKVCGICGTDRSFYHWGEAIANTYQIDSPRILGHEFAGVVAQVGSAVQGIKTGERVTVNPIYYCGQCSYCAEGLINICDNRQFLGINLNGAFAQFIAVKAQNVIKLPDSVSFISGALMEPLCVAIHAVERVKPGLGEVAVVIGAGAIGLLILMVLKAIGISRVIVTGLGVHKDRLQLAKSLGAETINIEEQDPVSIVKDITGGRGADMVFDAAGRPSAVSQAMKLVAKRGRIGITGFPAKPSEIMMTEVSLKEISLIGNRAYKLKTWQQACKLLEGGLNVEPMATHTLSLKDWERAFSLIDQRKGLRVLLAP
ncbi:alcohol dehydrogenase catalytic domain-containing protein [Desulfallas sp. Bu1-1]|uniref:zinc-dependent alcohol dehydrogenase n=1 Tax=Desulfallas sp. Bu1-1 TaxID=2787620 RepID=UPI0018A08823|nr:alcohol dehydrogenase catalytic domain-containing protein [Desulfallas sp. Bu1-1]MBF7082510.1 alcohol dehydrogenase catalytic domain-containing protein [Desulfallas sp. Bu1-1]